MKHTTLGIKDRIFLSVYIIQGVETIREGHLHVPQPGRTLTLAGAG